jgi:uncharacterized protein (TIGR02118 family)
MQGGNMIRVTVLFPKTSDSHFDMDYYLSKHVPMTMEKLRSTGATVSGTVDEGLGNLMMPEEPTPYAVVGTLLFEKMEDLQNGLARHGSEIMADFPNFTNIQPVIQVNKVVISV